MREILEQAWQQAIPQTSGPGNEEPVRISVCYETEFGPDLRELSLSRQLSIEEAIHLHTNRIYRVYMIGFLPGFTYLGKLDPRLETPRKTRPVPVLAGSVGIAGNQAGIYSLNSPGGWHIIGRTPVKLFDPAKGIPVRLKTGDQVQFYPVSREEYLEIAGGSA
jgi:inhibitor of KinA